MGIVVVATLCCLINDDPTGQTKTYIFVIIWPLLLVSYGIMGVFNLIILSINKCPTLNIPTVMNKAVTYLYNVCQNFKAKVSKD